MQKPAAGFGRQASDLKPEAESLLPSVLTLFIHVLDRRFVNHHVGRTAAGYFQAALVVPLDDTMNFFAVAEHNDHRRPRLHLFLVVKILRVGLLGGRDFTAAAVSVVAIIALGAVSSLSC